MQEAARIGIQDVRLRQAGRMAISGTPPAQDDRQAETIRPQARGRSYSTGKLVLQI